MVLSSVGVSGSSVADKLAWSTTSEEDDLLCRARVSATRRWSESSSAMYGRVEYRNVYNRSIVSGRNSAFNFSLGMENR